ncbi:hypothetical protein Q4489_08240 [Thalassotalea sp. 1_MG-2023]|uniref:hypothetical protein n=1 Tax=Thalassotalea sp. 1_MG-2023 TaxID=3062680 RepID=UPI0026E2E257|nr:hypothetical protein [Thalassotalea sp. 1_MG-2023]MDO6426996.1 hypothetical protein [Thalassotalea sp. 1_MG-2023]
MEITSSAFHTQIQGSHQVGNAKSDSDFAQILAGYQPNKSENSKVEVRAESVFNMNTNQGNNDVNLDEYLTNGPQTTPASLKDVELLLPTAHNVDTLAKYSQEKFKDLLSQYNIASPPETISFDNEGQIVIPADYPYTAQLKQALTENPIVENALRTTAALASHYAGIMEGQPFRDEMATARSQADRDRVIEKYSYLFDDNRPAKQIILSFLEDGSLLLGEKKLNA